MYETDNIEEDLENEQVDAPGHEDNPPGDSKLDKHENFKRIAQRRVTAALKQIGLIGNLSNPNSYAYTQEHIEKMFTTLRQELDKAEKRFQVETNETPVFKFDD